MTTNTSTKEEKPATTLVNDDSRNNYQEQKPSEEKDVKGDSNNISDECAESNSIGEESNKESSENRSNSEENVAEPVSEETREQSRAENAEQPSITADELPPLKSIKNSKKKINPKNIIKTPNTHDVLLGRGKPFQNHDGNQSMLRIVDMYRKRYHESERAFKHEIIEEVLELIKSKGGRFLERIDDFEKSFWNQVPHRMAYRKVGHAFRSNARKISMEKRDQAQNQRRNASAMARASMMSQLANTSEGVMQRMSLQEMISGGGAMGIGGSFYNDGANMYRQGGAGLNQTQRQLLAQEQMLHSSRIERILGKNSNISNLASSTATHPLLCGVESLPFSMGGGSLAERSLQIDDMRRRMMLLGPGAVAAHPNPYPFANSGTASGTRIPNIGISNVGGNLGDSSLK